MLLLCYCEPPSPVVDVFTGDLWSRFFLFSCFSQKRRSMLNLLFPVTSNSYEAFAALDSLLLTANLQLAAGFCWPLMLSTCPNLAWNSLEVYVWYWPIYSLTCFFKLWNLVKLGWSLGVEAEPYCWREKIAPSSPLDLNGLLTECDRTKFTLCGTLLTSVEQIYL